MIYRNTAGVFTIEVSDPSPSWVTITQERSGDSIEMHGLLAEDLHDLRHLIDRALTALEPRR